MAAAGDEVEIRGHVFDALAGVDAPVAGAQVRFWQDGAHSTLTTDAAGVFRFILTPQDGEAETFALWAQAEGYFTELVIVPVIDLQRAGGIEIALRPAPARVVTVVSGLVYDVSIGPDAPIAGAAVTYTYDGGSAYPDVSDVVRTDPDGRYRIELPLGPDDSLALHVEADGYGVLSRGFYVAELPGGMAPDFALPPLGGVALVEPGAATLRCAAGFTVAVANVGPPDELLTIIDFQFGFAYSQGVYGQNFSWDISQIQFPLVLAPGEQVEFPVWFDPGDFASRLYFTVISGSREGASATYFGGRSADCGCAGDCDGDGHVSVGELVRAVGVALGAEGGAACPMLDGDANAVVSISEILAAVGNALRGCPA
ncbi:MAG: hypothetical protein ACRERC_12705 [Candidatus Binatia bacterium]